MWAVYFIFEKCENCFVKENTEFEGVTFSYLTLYSPNYANKAIIREKIAYMHAYFNYLHSFTA